MIFMENLARTFKTSFSVCCGRGSLNNHCLCTSTPHPVTPGRLWHQGNHKSSVRFILILSCTDKLHEKWQRDNIVCSQHHCVTVGVASFYCGMQTAHLDFCWVLQRESNWSSSQSGVLICATKTANCILAAWTITITWKKLIQYFKLCYWTLVICIYTFASYLSFLKSPHFYYQIYSLKKIPSIAMMKSWLYSRHTTKTPCVTGKSPIGFDRIYR